MHPVGLHAGHASEACRPARRLSEEHGAQFKNDEGTLFSLGLRPNNDNFTNRTSISGSAIAVGGTLSGATLETPETDGSVPGGLLGTGGRFLAITENYPQLKSNESFLKLQDELAGTENRLATSRRDYTLAAQDYNTTRNRFPTVVMAGLMGFKEQPYFQADEGAQQAPKVDFGK